MSGSTTFKLGRSHSRQAITLSVYDGRRKTYILTKSSSARPWVSVPTADLRLHSTVLNLCQRPAYDAVVKLTSVIGAFKPYECLVKQ